MSKRRQDVAGGSRLATVFTMLLFTAAVLLIWERFIRPVGALHDRDARPRVVEPRGKLSDFEQSTIEIYKQASPSVVHVTNLVTGRDRLTMDILAIPQGTGSGFLWDDQGYVVTNYHVVVGGKAFQVTLADHSTYEGRLVGEAPHKDLAVLKIEAPRDKLIPIRVGTSGDLQVGQMVYAIGNPFGLDQTLTTGVISGLDREVRSPQDIPIPGVIQSDAAINPGNSGGPLLDSNGRLIGINTSILTTSGVYAGIGFAVPVDTVNRIVPEIIRTGRAGRAGLGVRLLSDQMRRQLGFDRGALIGEVTSGSPADRAGLQASYRTRRGIVPGDLILSVDDRKIESVEDLYSVLASYAVGESVSLTIVREGDRVEESLILEDIDR